MGADMTLAGFATSRQFAQGDTIFREQRKHALLAAIDLLEARELVDFGASYGDSEDISDLKNLAKETVEEVFKSLEYRNVTTWYYKKVVFYFTGGMSWGDSPTDTYDCFDKFSSLPDKVLEHLLL